MKYIAILLIGFFLCPLHSKIAPQTATLSNGLKVIVFQNPILPSVTVLTKYGVGTADDPVYLLGLSHMLEHMMFKGSSKYPKDSLDRIINSCGGFLNAHTNFDTTVYTFSLPAEYLETILDIEADRMENLELQEEDFLPEQKVVLEERKMRLGNHPLGKSSEIYRRALYTAHPYGIFPIGYESHIKAYTIDALKDHYKKWYIPNNATIVVVGPYDLAYVLPLVEKKFLSINAKELPVVDRAVEPDREGLTTTIEQENPKAENIYIKIAYRVPTLIEKPEAYLAMRMLEATLTGSDSRLLTKQMVKEKRLALGVECDYSCGRNDMEFTFNLILSPEMNVEKAEKFLFEQLHKFLKKGLIEKDFNKAKKEACNIFAFSMDGEAFLMALANSVLSGFPVEAISKYEDFLQSITVKQTHEMLHLVLEKPPIVIARFYPKGKMPKRNYQEVLGL
ncbi:MAG: M16 family metallopeptidase [Pseudomonadota bacterium]|jgi:zinc protease|nr:insulinase family protein [Alphaproteobacteria bacterium]